MRFFVVFCVVAVAVGFDFVGLSFAQQTEQSVSSSPVTTEASEETAKKPFTITPSGTIELPKGTTTHLVAAIAAPPEGLKNSTAGVNLNGYIGYVPYQGKNLMVTVVDTVSKGDHSVAIPRRIEAQEYRDKTVLSQQDEIALEVDPADLDAAIDALAKAAEDTETDKKAEPEQQQSAPESAASSGGGGSGGGTSGNSLAGSYQNPQQADFTEPETEIRTSTDGCEVRIDDSQNVAIQTSKTQTFEGGKLKSESTCTDSENRYPLQKSFAGCDDVIDVNALRVYRQSQTYSLFV